MPASPVWSISSGIDVMTLPMRKSGASEGWMMEPCRPSSPNPALSPMGMWSRSLSPIGCSTLQG